MDQGNETVEDVSVKARGGSAANTCRRGLGKVTVIGLPIPQKEVRFEKIFFFANSIYQERKTKNMNHL
jgi:hypothetical protein